MVEARPAAEPLDRAGAASASLAAIQSALALSGDQLTPTLRNLLRGLSSADRTRRLDSALRERLEATADPALRNALAVALADLRSPLAPEVIRVLLLSPRTRYHRGTLLYALHELQATLPLDLVLKILIEDVGEAQEEALTFLEEGRFDRPGAEDLEDVRTELRAAIEAEADADRRAVLHDAAEILDEVAPA